MTAYHALFAIAMPLALVNLSKDSRIELSYPFLLMFFVLFVGLRYGSVDYGGYLRIYEHVPPLASMRSPADFFRHSVEPGYAFLTSLAKTLSVSFPAFLFGFALISLAIKFTAFRKLSPYLFLTIVLYLSEYFFKDLGQIRNAAASGIVLAGLPVLANGNRRAFVLLVLLAASIQAVALAGLGLLFYPLFRTRRGIMFLLVVSLVVSIAGGLGALITDAGASVFGWDRNYRIVRYMTSQYAEQFRLFGGEMSVRLFVAATLLVCHRRIVTRIPFGEIVITTNLLGVAGFLLLRDYGILAGRISDLFFMPTEPIALAMVFAVVDRRLKPIALLTILAYAALFFWIRSQGARPYDMILFNM